MARHATTKFDEGVDAQRQLSLRDLAGGVDRTSPAGEAIVFRPPDDYDIPLPALRRILAVLLAEMGLHSSTAAR